MCVQYSVAKIIIYLKAWPSARISKQINYGEMKLCSALVEVGIRSTLIHFPFPLLPQGSCRYNLARLDLPREGSAFAVHKLACWKLWFGTCWGCLLKDELFQRLSIVKESSPSLSLVLALLVNTSHLWQLLINLRQEFLVYYKQLSVAPLREVFFRIWHVLLLRWQH